MQVIGHRGAPDAARENTLESFEKAIAAGAEIIEFDVRVTADGRLAVIHDQVLGGQKVAQVSFEKLNSLAAKENFSVPDMQSALRVISGRAKAQIEIKERGHEEQVVNAALSVLGTKDFSIISFYHGVLEKICSRHENIELGLILSYGKGHIRQLFDFILRRKKILKTVNYFALDLRLAKPQFLRLIPKRFPVSVWTADDPEKIQEFLNNPRLFAVASNRPGLVREILNRIIIKPEV